MYKQSLFAVSALAMLTSNLIASAKLDEVVVTAKSNKSIEDISSSITVITAEQISKLNATNIKDILVRTPGIIKTAAGVSSGGRESFSIRGLDNTYSLILVDGKKVNPTDDYIGHSDFQYSWVPIGMIKRIEVIKGPKSSIYGSQAIGGVINIITKNDTRKIYGEIDLQAGFSSAKKGGNEQKISANIGGNVSDKLYLFAGINDNKRDATGGPGFTAFGSATNNATFVEGLKSKDAIVKLKYAFDDTQSISGSYMKGEEERKDFNKSDSPSYEIKRDLYNIGYEKSLEDISFSLDYSKTKSDSKADSLFAKYTHALENDTLKGEAKISMLKNNYIVVGAETSKDSYDRIRSTGATQYGFESRANAYYLQDEIEIDDFIFTLGGRFNDNEKYGSEFSPNIGAVYKLTENQRLKLSYGQGFKAPSLIKGSDGFGTGSHGAPFGNDNLKAETSESYELGYEFYGQDTIFKTAIFKTDVENMITTEGVSPQVKYQNVDMAGTKGFELGIEYNINENNTINANYTYVQTEDKTTGNKLTYKPENTFNIGIISQYGYGVSSYVSANYIGKQYTNSSNTSKASGYTIFNAQISKKLSSDITARIGVDNISDEKFDDNDPYYLKRRVAYVGLNYKF